MIEWIQASGELAIVVLFIAATADIFFVTGLFLYGAAMMTTVATLYATGTMSAEVIFVCAYGGTLLGNILNFYVGRLFDKSPMIEKKLQHPKIQKGKHFLETKGLFLYIGICRFVAVSRPLYALVLGSLKIKFSRFIFFEAIIAFFWVLFWLVFLIQGASLFLKLFR
jgi:membrane protein DedA with SNARE-associated domain